jgi:hypothetical protein
MIFLTNNPNNQLVTIIYVEIKTSQDISGLNFVSYPNLEKLIIDIELHELFVLPFGKFSLYTKSKLQTLKINSNSLIYFQDDLVSLLCDKIKLKTLDLSNCPKGTVIPDKFSSIENIILKEHFNNYLNYNNITHTFGKVDYTIRAKTLICSYLNPKYLIFLRDLPCELEYLRINSNKLTQDNDSYNYPNSNDVSIVNYLDNLPPTITLIQIHKSWNVNIKRIEKIPFNCKIEIFI